MSRIITNVPSLLAQRILGQQNSTLTKSLERLSTGYRINRGADDPAGLIASEKMRSEKAAIDAAIGNAERADQVMNIAEGGLQEINSLLTELQSLVGQSANDAGLSAEEKEANQLQVDSILQTIDRIASTTSFEGIKLLNGTYDFTIASQDADVQDYEINAAKLEHGDTRDVQVVVTESAQHGTLFLSFASSVLETVATSGALTFELTGAKGGRQFSFASGTSLDAIATGINAFKSVTGVSAVAAGTVLTMKSDEFGSTQFVGFKLINDAGQTGNVYYASAPDETTMDAATVKAFTAIENSNEERDAGQDIGATINGVTATGTGKTARINTDFLDLSLTLTDTGAQTLATINAFTITGGGAKFNLGPNVDITNQVSVGIKDVAARKLGTVDSGYLSDLAKGKDANVVTGSLEDAQTIINSAIDQVSALRGRLGAFQKNVVGATIRSLGVALENTSAAESAIRDTDFAAETAELTRSQILVSAATNVLAIANSQPQSVLKLLG
jgi:flagellin